MPIANDSIDPHRIRDGILQLKSGIAAVTSAEKALLKTKAERLSALRREA